MLHPSSPRSRNSDYSIHAVFGQASHATWRCADFTSTASFATMPASMTPVQTAAKGRQFPKFDLARLLGTVFEPTFGRRICILIDLPDLAEAKDMAFLKNPERRIQQRAHESFYLGLKNGVLDELALKD